MQFRLCIGKTLCGSTVVLAGLLIVPGMIAVADAHPDAITETILEHVARHADTVLENARDTFADTPTPLLADAINLREMAPATLTHGGNTYVICNFANHQNFLRVLAGLSALTGEARYRETAETMVAWHFDHLRSDCGLLHWGGHRAFDLMSREYVTRNIHELKHCFPFYEFMWEVNPEATARFIRAFWNAHILDWDILDMNRHGSYGRSMGDLWNSEFTGAPPFFAGRGLTFINTGDDLIYSALMLHNLAGDTGALTWGMRLAQQYVNARHPETGLGVYQYSQAIRRADPPEDENAPNFTYSTFGDRTQRQFGPEFGEIALEGNYLPNERSIYSLNALMQLQMAEMLGDAGDAMRDYTLDGMRAYAQHAYNFENNTLTPMFADGTSLDGYEIKRRGYHGNAGRVIEASPASTALLHSYSLAYRISGDPALWTVVRGIARGHGLGDFGEHGSDAPDIHWDTDNSDPRAILALLEIERATGTEAYTRLASVVAQNILEQRFHNGMFASSADATRASIDTIEPLALLTLAAHMRGEPEAVPAYRGGRAFFSP